MAVIIASIGATAFIVFAMPDNITAQARNVIGGHWLRLFYGIFVFFNSQPALIYSIIGIIHLPVGATIFTMVETDTEHPLRPSTALGVAMTV